MSNNLVTIFRGDVIKEALDKLIIDVIVHGCNCFCVMGGGIAKSIAKTFPEAYEEDKKTVPGDESKLGTYTKYTYHLTKNSRKNHALTIVNAYTQYKFGRDKVHFDYDAFEKLVKQFNIDFKGKIVGMPWIGCGLAGGDRSKVLDILNRNVHTFFCYIYEL